MKTTYWTALDSPVGRLYLTSDSEQLTGILLPNHFSDTESRPLGVEKDDLSIFTRTRAQLEAYFQGTLQEFDLPLAPLGTAFQQRVWEELCRIPYGVTISYGELAQRIGSPKAVRAVGQANGRNPIPIVVPCHRVIGSSGKLVGYGGGLPVKTQLLALEGIK